MVFETKSKFNLKVKKASDVLKLHDAILDKYVEMFPKCEEMQPIAVRKSLFDKLTLPKNFKELINKVDFKKEDSRQNMCGNLTFHGRFINDNINRYFCFDYNDKHYTMSLIISRKDKTPQFKIQEIVSKNDKKACKAVFKYVQELLDVQNKNIKDDPYFDAVKENKFLFESLKKHIIEYVSIQD